MNVCLWGWAGCETGHGKWVSCYKAQSKIVFTLEKEYYSVRTQLKRIYVYCIFMNIYELLNESVKEGFEGFMERSVTCLKCHTWIPELLLFPLRRGF